MVLLEPPIGHQDLLVVMVVLVQVIQSTELRKILVAVLTQVLIMLLEELVMQFFMVVVIKKLTHGIQVFRVSEELLEMQFL